MLDRACHGRRLVHAFLWLVLLCGPLRVANAQPNVVGQWSAPASWPLSASHAALMADGRVLLWSDQSGVTPRLWNPTANGFATVAAINTNLAGSAQAGQADGTLAILGGHDVTGAGTHDAHRFDVVANTWTSLPFLTEPRNEPAAILLGDGRLFTLSGERLPGQPTDVAEALVAGSGAWIPFSNAPLALPRTPWSFWLSTGDLLVAGPDASTRRFDSDTSSWFAVSNLLAGTRDAGSALLLPGAPNRFLVTGGRNPAVATCEVLDLNTTTSWAWTGSMARARRFHNATILADGTVLVTGGTLLDDALDQAVYSAERYSATSGTWTTQASMTVPRRRASVALLLPDARVLCTGGGDGTPGSETHADAEIFSPPYLFLGSRPVITTAPASLVYGSQFSVDSPQAADVSDVWLVRAGTVTRGFNGDQRAVPLAFTAVPGRLTVTCPTDPNAAPPGTYMLFLVDDAGAPSIATMTRLQPGVVVPIQPTITSTAPTTTTVGVQFTYVPAASGTMPMTWSLVTNPGWLAISPSTGAIAGLPLVTGPASIRLRATNAGGFADQAWTLNVVSAISVRTVIPLGATWRYFKGTTNPAATWATIGFNDASWLQGPSGFGFGDNDDATVLSDMVNVYSTVFTRKAFNFYNVNTVSKVSILYEYDDGLAVYLNGTRILAQNAPATIVNTSLATSSHEATLNLIRQDFTNAATRALLVNGANVLAAVGLNNSLSSSDLTLKVTLELTGGTDTPVDAAPPMTEAFAPGVHPNPFTSQAAVRFATTRFGTATLRVYDPAGHLVREIGAPGLGAGPHEILWDGRDRTGANMPPGVYLYRLTAPGQDHRGKLTHTR